jgi:hypothetical protein
MTNVSELRCSTCSIGNGIVNSHIYLYTYTQANSSRPRHTDRRSVHYVHLCNGKAFLVNAVT